MGVLWGAINFNADALSDDPFVAWGRGLLADAGTDYKTSGLFGPGYNFSFAMVQAVQIAGELEGGLTRTDLMLAIRALDVTHPASWRACSST